MGDTLFLAQGIEAAITSTYGIDPSECKNLLDRNQNTLWTATGSATISIRIDMGAEYYASAIGLINNNSYTGGNDSGTWGYWRVQSADDWAFTTNVVTRLSNVTPVAADEPIAYRDFGTPGSDRYWKIYIQSCLINVSHFGYLLLGKPVKPPLPYDRPRRYRSQYGADITETRGGHRFSDLRHDERLIWNPADYTLMTDSDWDELMDYLWRAAKGPHRPVLFQDVDDSLHWVRVNLGGGLDYSEDKKHVWHGAFTLEQEF